MERYELLRIVREVGREILEDTPNLVEKKQEFDQAAKAQLSAEGEQDSIVSVRGSKGWLALINHFKSSRDAGIPENKDIKYNLGQVQDSSSRDPASVARELKDGTDNPANALIKAIRLGKIERGRPYAGFYDQKTRRWVPLGIKKDLGEIAKNNPQFNQQFAESVELLIITGEVPKQMSQHAYLVAEVAALWFGQEPAREPANITMSIMNLDLAKQAEILKANEDYKKRLDEKGLKPLKGIDDAITEHPASAIGYQKAVKNLNEQLQGQQLTKQRSKNVEKQKQRIIEQEIATLIRWFEAKYATGQLNNVGDDRESIKRVILEAVKNFYGI